jgi:hypothetical protein
VLITAEEAARPDDMKTGVSLIGDLRAGRRPPEAELVAPVIKLGGDSKLPFELKIKFTANGSAKIDQSSIQVTYLKIPSVDLTARLKKYTKNVGIDVPQAEMPPGVHYIGVSLKDTQGYPNFVRLKLTVEPK